MLALEARLVEHLLIRHQLLDFVHALSHEEHFGAFTGTHFLALGADAASAAVIVAVGQEWRARRRAGSARDRLWAGPRLRET